MPVLRPVLLTAILLVATIAASQSANSSAAPPPKPCTQPQARQLDFWVGEWDLSTPGQKDGEVVHNSNSIKHALDGCVIEENFVGGPGTPLQGRSFSMFDAPSGKWKQTWVDNQGAYLDFVGEFKDGQMVLARETTGPNGANIQQRMVFKNITASEFDWNWESSKDGGKTWQVIWPIHYKRKS